MLSFKRFFTTCFLLTSFQILTLSLIAQLSKIQIDSLKKELLKAKEDTSKVNLFKTLGNEIGYYDLNGALKYSQVGYALSNKLNYQPGIGKMAYLIGITYGDLGSYSLSDSFLNIAEKKFSQLGDKLNLAKVSNARGGQSFMRGNYWLAADFYIKAAEMFDDVKDTASSLIAYQNLISVLGETKNYEKAVLLGKKTLKIAELRKDSLAIGYGLQTLCTHLVYLDRLEEVRLHYLDALLAIADKTIDDNLSADAYSTIGTYYFKKANYDSASFYFKKAITMAQTLENKYQLANHYNSLGQAFLKQNNLDEARQYLLKAMTLAKDFKNTRAIYDVALSLSDYYAATGDYKRSNENLELHLKLKDSILNAGTMNYSAYIETKYETNKKENEILQLQKVQQQKDFTIKRRNIYIGIAAGLLVTMFIILALLKRNFKSRQKLAQQQAAIQKEKIVTMEKQQQVVSLQSMINGQETERIRIAKDLHDGLGGVFSTVKMHYSTLQHEVPEIKNNSLYRKTFDLINSASDELRKVAHNMMPEVLMKVGLVEALKDFCSNISSGKLLKISLQTFGMEKRLSTSTEIMLFRIIQELINNIIKHAYATEAIIQFNREGNRLSIIIEDNGRGFDTKEAGEKASMGMTTVKSRVDYLNGKLTIDSRRNIGTTVMIDLLLNENQ
jgi:two-component system NarL family sensor kinase